MPLASTSEALLVMILRKKLWMKSFASRQNTYDASTEVLLSKRNAQLAKFTEHDDVKIQSKSLEWLFEYLKKHYGLETN